MQPVRIGVDLPRERGNGTSVASSDERLPGVIPIEKT